MLFLLGLCSAANIYQSVCYGYFSHNFYLVIKSNTRNPIWLKRKNEKNDVYLNEYAVYDFMERLTKSYNRMHIYNICHDEKITIAVLKITIVNIWCSSSYSLPQEMGKRDMRNQKNKYKRFGHIM